MVNLIKYFSNINQSRYTIRNRYTACEALLLNIFIAARFTLAFLSSLYVSQITFSKRIFEDTTCILVFDPYSYKYKAGHYWTEFLGMVSSFMLLLYAIFKNSFGLLMGCIKYEFWIYFMSTAFLEVGMWWTYFLFFSSMKTSLQFVKNLSSFCNLSTQYLFPCLLFFLIQNSFSRLFAKCCLSITQYQSMVE